MTEDWVDFLFALLDAKARFLVVGAHALAVYGVPRGTQDLDVWIDPKTGYPMQMQLKPRQAGPGGEQFSLFFQVTDVNSPNIAVPVPTP